MTAPHSEAPSSCIGLVGAGHMGSGLGWALREGGARVVTTLAGRSERTARMVAAVELEVVADLETLVGTVDYVLVVTPPGEAIDAATAIAEAARRTGATPLVIDMNAIAPQTAETVAETLAPLEFVDGSISGPPPTVRPGARIYLSGPRAAEVAALSWQHVTPIDLGARIGAASALKMSSASVYKGLVGLYTQAFRAADEYGVLDAFCADVAGQGFDLVEATAVAATKADRYVPEMREIARAQAAAGLSPELFEAFAELYAELGTLPLAAGDPETVDSKITAAEVASRLRR